MNRSELIFGRKMSAEIAATTNEPRSGGGVGGGGGGSNSTIGLAGRIFHRVAREALASAHEMVTSQQQIQTSGYLASGQYQQRHQHPMAIDKIDTNYNEQLQLQQQQQQRFQNLAATAPLMLPLIQQQQQEQQLQLQLQQTYEQQQPEQSFSEKWDDYWSKQPFPSGYTQSSIVLLACFISTFIFLIVVGNLLVCIAIFTEKSLRPTQNWFIASLAVSDMLLGALVMPGSLARELMGFWAFGPFWCDVHESIDVLLTTASINTLCLISLDRYWSITQAVSYLKKRTPRRGASMIAFVWIFSAAVSLPPLFGWKKESPTIRAAVNTSGHTNSSTNRKSPVNYHNHHHSTISTAKPTSTSSAISSPDDFDQTLDATQDQRQQRRKRRRLRGRPKEERENESNPNELSNLQQDQSNLFDEEQENFLANTIQPMLLSTNAQHQPPLASTIQQLDLSTASTTNQDNGQQIQEYPTCQLSDDIGYVLYSALGSFYIPCAVMVFTYIKIFLAARSRARRAINKQSRIGASGGGGNAGKRVGGRNNRRAPTPDRKQLIGSSAATATAALAGSAIMSSGNPQALKSAAAFNAAPPMSPPPGGGVLKGKIVIVERKKSLASSLITTTAATTAPSNQQQQLQSSQLRSIGGAAHQHHVIELDEMEEHKGDYNNNESGCCQGDAPTTTTTTTTTMMSLCTSAAVLASPSALNATSIHAAQATDSVAHHQHQTNMSSSLLAGDSSSTITVMNPSMGELPVTRFNFNQSSNRSQSGGSLHTSASETNDLRMTVLEVGVAGGDSSAGPDSNGRHKAAALLRAISQVSETFAKNNVEADKLLSEVGLADDNGGGDGDGDGDGDDDDDDDDDDKDNSSRVPDIVVERRATNVSGGLSDLAESINEVRSGEVANASEQQQLTSGALATNETCFMTIEEDSDMFDAQAGRTIMMIAGNNNNDNNNKKKFVNNVTIGSGNSNGQSNKTCQQQTVICNNVACQQQQQRQQSHQRQPTNTTATTTTTRSASSYCGSSMTINDDYIDDCVDDEMLTDDCNGYSVSCGLDQYCSGTSASNCPHCQELEGLSCNELATSGPEHLESSGAKSRQTNDGQTKATHAHNHTITSSSRSPMMTTTTTNDKQFRLTKANNVGINNNDNNDNDNNIDLEAQSLTGDDNLSLTEYRSNEDSSSIIGHDVLDATESHRKPQQPGDRKKSLIGFRLNRLGSNAPLSAHSGGLLALASNQHQQMSTGGAGMGATGGATVAGTRNLKALRQNFFLKLNQLTAKSAAKQQRKANQASPTGNKSSAPSSGTSYEPSVDYATTSNVHSTDYHQDTMIGEQTDDYEQQTSSDNQQAHNHHQQQPQSQRSQPKFNSDTDAATISGSASQGRGSRSNESRPNTRSDLNRDKTTTTTSTNDRVLLLRAPNDELSAGMKLASSGNNNNSNRKSLMTSDSNLLLPEDSSRASSSSKQLQVVTSTGNSRSASGGPNKRGTSTGGSQTNRSVMSAGTTQGGGSQATSKTYLASDNERHKRKLAKARERRATLILGIIMTAFICSWMPFFTFYVLRAVCPTCRDYMTGYPKVEAFIFWMGYCNSAINPIIYTIFNRDFRKAFRKILFRCL